MAHLDAFIFILLVSLQIFACGSGDREFKEAENMMELRLESGKFDQMCLLLDLHKCPENKNTQFLYWHIPKSGGTTMWQIFKHHFQLDFVRCSTAEDGAHWKEKRESLNNLKPKFALGANLSILMRITDSENPIILMGFFRDPVDLRRSLYFYRQNPPKSEKDRKSSANLTVKQFLEQRHLSMPNFLCASLSGTPQYLGHFVTKKHLAMAQKHISNLLVFMLSDFSHGIQMIQDLLGWQLHKTYSGGKANARRSTNTTLSGEDLELIKEVNWCDVELYKSIEEQYNRVKIVHEFMQMI